MTSVDSPTFGMLLRRWRRAASLTQEELAERAGMSVETISALERGISRSPYQATVASLADALELDHEDRAHFLSASRLEHGDPVPEAAGEQARSVDKSTLPSATGSLALALTSLHESPRQGFLIIALDRQDVVLPGDLALRKVIRRLYGLDRLPSQQEVLDLAERWRPYRSPATSYLFQAAYGPNG